MPSKKKKRAPVSGPERATTALRKARAAWKRRQFDRALTEFSAAVRADPRNVEIRIEASRAHAARYRWDRAAQLLDRATETASRDHRLQHRAGQSYRAIGHFADAEACFRRAIEIRRPAPHSELELAKLCERLNRLDEAAELVDRVLHAESRSLAALCLRGRVFRRLDQFDEAETTLRRLIVGARSHPVQVAEALAELSLVYDQQGRFDEAWQAILQCKAIQAKRSGAEERAARFVERRFAKMADAITAGHFARWRAESRGELPQTRTALLTGFPRSGTTLLEQVLDAHPDVVSSEERDVFSSDVFPRLGEHLPPDAAVEKVLDGLSRETCRRERATYLELMQAMLPEPIGDRLHLDKNPAMTPMIPAMMRIFPDLKCIIALRDPRDVIVSCFLRYLPLNPISVCFLSIERAAERYTLDMHVWHRIREVLPENWVEVRYEDAVRDLPGEARRITTAIGLDWDASVLAYRERLSRKHVMSPSYDAVARPLFTTAIGRWRNYRRHLEPVMIQLEPWVERFGYA